MRTFLHVVPTSKVCLRVQTWFKVRIRMGLGLSCGRVKVWVIYDAYVSPHNDRSRSMCACVIKTKKNEQ